VVKVKVNMDETAEDSTKSEEGAADSKTNTKTDDVGEDEL
jgi:hypothetical protein